MVVLLSPLEQFEVLPLFAVFSNIWIYIFFYATLVFGLTSAAIFKQKNTLLFWFNPNLIDFTSFISIPRSILFNTTLFGDFFFIIFIVLTLFLLSANVLGISPLGFTVTAHLVISLSWSFFFFVWINIIFFFRFFLEWGAIFLPSGTPTVILPLIVPIEFLSYFSRILSLAIRLFANMMSGHTLIHILISFFYKNITPNLLLFLPFLIIQAILIMEIGVAFLQVYVFLVLISLYIHDVRSYDTH